MTYNVRFAREEDIDQILVELKKFSKFFDMKYELYPVDENYAREFVYQMIHDHVMFVCVDGSDELIGFIAGMFSPHIFNPQLKT